MRNLRFVNNCLAASLLSVFVLGLPGHLCAQVLRVFPTQNGQTAPAPLRESCLDPGAWPTGWARTNLFGNAVQFFAQMTDVELAQCFFQLRSQGKELAIETGALKPHCATAQLCWDTVIGQLERFESLGARLDYLAIDEPLTTGSVPPPPYNYAVQETAEWVRIARQRFPGVKIILIEAFPTQSAETLTSFFRDVNNGVIARTGWGIQYAEIDHDWGATGFGAFVAFSVRSIQDTVRADGMGFGVIFWATGGYAWHPGLMHQGFRYQDWRSAIGIAPDLVSVANWTGLPNDTLPESMISGARSFTNSVRDFANAFLAAPTSVHGLRGDEWLNSEESRTSIDGRFRLVYQADGNLVLYFGATPLWNTVTSGTAPGRAIMQADGNFVVYNDVGSPLWHSSTFGNPGAFLVVQSDGNLVIYSGHRPIWASNTAWY